jgi:hypothetical protein
LGANATTAVHSDCRIEPRSATPSRVQRARMSGSCATATIAPTPMHESSVEYVHAPPPTRCATSGMSASSAVE